MSPVVFFCLIGAAFAVPFYPTPALPLARVYGLTAPHYYTHGVEGVDQFAVRSPLAVVESVDAPVFARNVEGNFPHVQLRTAGAPFVSTVETPAFVKATPVYADIPVVHEKPEYRNDQFYVPALYKAVPALYKAFPSIYSDRSPVVGLESTVYTEVPAEVESPIYAKTLSPLAYKVVPSVYEHSTPIVGSEEVSPVEFGRAFAHPAHFNARFATVAPFHAVADIPSTKFYARSAPLAPFHAVSDIPSTNFAARFAPVAPFHADSDITSTKFASVAPFHAVADIPSTKFLARSAPFHADIPVNKFAARLAPVAPLHAVSDIPSTNFAARFAPVAPIHTVSDIPSTNFAARFAPVAPFHSAADVPSTNFFRSPLVAPHHLGAFSAYKTVPAGHESVIPVDSFYAANLYKAGVNAVHPIPANF